MGSPGPAAGRKPTYTLERQQIGPITHLRVCGTIDDTFQGARQADSLVGHVLIDLGRIGRISSFGVRQFMELTQKLPLGAFGLYLMNVPPVLVDQLNMVEGFAGLAQVLSLLAPYGCEKCGEERVRVIDVRASEEVLAAGGAPEFECPSCASPMRFADQATEFFNYVQQHPVRSLDPVIERYLISLGQPRAADQLKPVKIVQDDLTYVRMSSTIRQDLSSRPLTSGLEGTVVYDFASVAHVEPGGEKKLIKVFEQASAEATVVLWRLPPVVVTALAGLELSPKVAVASLWLPCECRGCGSSLPQAIAAAEYLRAVSSSTPDRRTCGVCGAPAEVPALEGASQLLADHSAAEVPYTRISEIEPKAASQLLHFSTQSDGTPSGTPAGEASTRAAPHTGRTGQEPALARDDAQNLHLLKHLGRGGMAEVFLARQVGQQGVEKYVVVKRVLPALAEQGDFVEMLFAEARANARLTHPNVVQIFDVGSMGGVAHLSMEYVRGPDLKKVLLLARKSGTSVPVGIGLRIIAEIAAGLHYAHTFVDPLGNPHPVIHRDVSPHNVLISLDGAVKLSDFGIAKVNDGGEGTRPGTFKGKIHYSSPEQIRGMPLDARHDLFSLGIVLFETITGFLPFKGENDVATLTQIAQLPTPDPRQAIPSLPEDLVEVMQHALAKAPDERFASAGELREAIEDVMVHNRYRASPIDVARYVRDILGERLVEFTPQGLTDPGNLSGPRSSSSPSLRALTPPFTPSGVRAALATGRGPDGVPLGGDAAMPKTATLARPTGTTPAPGSGSIPRPSAPSKGGSGLIKTTGLTPHPSAPGTGTTPHPSAPSKGGSGLIRTTGLAPHPSASGTTPRPASASGQTPASGTTPRPGGATGHTPMPPPPSGLAPLAPSGPLGATPGLVAAPLGGAPGQAAGEQPRRRRWWPLIALGALAGCTAAATVAAFSFGGDPAVEVSTLRAGETLFLDGLEVDPATLQPQSDEAPPVAVAVAEGGVLKRMGTARVGRVLDLQPLFEAAADEGQTGSLSITTAVPGCAVELNGKPLPTPTPATLSIAAGRVMELKISCAEKPPLMRKVLAASGQHIEAGDAPPPAPKQPEAPKQP